MDIIKNKHILKNKSKIWFFALSFIFVAINSYLLYKENFLLTLLPIAIIILGLGILSLDRFLILITFFTPLSIALSEVGLNKFGVDMFLPTEPLLVFSTILFFISLLYNKKFDRKILIHPISIAIFINLTWILITSLTSTYPLISIKFFISRLWFVIPFYIIATEMFRHFHKIKKFLYAYIISFSFVVIYSLLRLKTHGLVNESAAHWVMSPFYKDHTSYGAILAMFLPVLFALTCNSKKKIIKYPLIFLNIIFFLGFLFSYTRAAWISLVIAIGVFFIIKLKIKFRTVFIVTATILGLFFSFKTQIILKLEQNQEASNKGFYSHIRSISNISNDDSNLERINRWNSALRMFKEKPVLGWGPGTYTENYAPFQLSHQKTLISTNAGDRGNAHSEYLGPLSESGILGLLTFIIIIGLVIHSSVKTYRKIEDKEIKNIHLGVILGLITYFVHGFLNNFLDTDKASVPFWGFIAVLVAIELFHKTSRQELKD